MGIGHALGCFPLVSDGRQWSQSSSSEITDKGTLTYGGIRLAGRCTIGNSTDSHDGLPLLDRVGGTGPTSGLVYPAGAAMHLTFAAHDVVAYGHLRNPSTGINTVDGCL